MSCDGESLVCDCGQVAGWAASVAVCEISCWSAIRGVDGVSSSGSSGLARGAEASALVSTSVCCCPPAVAWANVIGDNAAMAAYALWSAGS